MEPLTRVVIADGKAHRLSISIITFVSPRRSPERACVGTNTQKPAYTSVDKRNNFNDFR